MPVAAVDSEAVGDAERAARSTAAKGRMLRRMPCRFTFLRGTRMSRALRRWLLVEHKREDAAVVEAAVEERPAVAQAQVEAEDKGADVARALLVRRREW